MREIEQEAEKTLREGVKKLGGRAYKFVSPGNSGVPDRIVILPDRPPVFVELKRPGEEPRKLQKVQIRITEKTRSGRQGASRDGRSQSIFGRGESR